MSKKKDSEDEKLGPPSEEKLGNPFFAYGIFKPGQLGFSQIKKFVEGDPSEEIIDYEMFYRDGIPLVDNHTNEIYQTKGYLISFTDPEAYNIIGDAKTSKLYEWGEIEINNKPVNILFGIDAHEGSFNNREYIISDYDFRNDDYFTTSLELIGEFIDQDIVIKGPREFFQYQMHFVLLWSVIERFGTFKYGKSSINQNNKALAKHPIFRKNLGKVKRRDIVYSSKDHEDKELNPPNWWSIKYYYTIRSNVVHRGKSVSFEDKQKLKLSLRELYCIFKAVKDYEFESN